MTQQVWQIAAGESGRYYDQLFLDHDIMFLGPGRFGEFSITYANAVSRSDYRCLKDFRDGIQTGDVVLLRKGRQVRAIGLAVAGYQFFEQLDDIYGWDLQHLRRVRWQPQLESALVGLQFGAARMPTLTRVLQESLRAAIEPLISQCVSQYPQDLLPLPPAPTTPLSWDEVKQELYLRGLRYDAAEKTVGVLQHIARLSEWYADNCRPLSRPTEHEVVAHMVIPLLIALGWSEQQLAVEWQHIDLAAFWGMPPATANCVLVCEVKGRGRGLQDVIDQADRYVKERKLTGCRRVLVTDGTCYYLYDRDGDVPVGYFNVHRLRTTHIAPAGTNAIDTIIALTPAGIHNPIPQPLPPTATITASIPMIKRIGGG